MRSYLRACGYALLFTAVLVFLLLQERHSTGEKLWPDYYTLISTDAEGIEKVLTPRVPEPGILSVRTLTVRVNAFDGVLKLPLAELDAHLLPEDPRYDPFLKSLPDLFQAVVEGEEAEILYIPASIDLASIENSLEAAGVAAGEYTLVDDRSSPSLRLLLLFGLLGLAVVAVQRRHRLTAAVLLLPWGLGLIVAGPGAGILSFLALFIIPRGTTLVLPYLLAGKHLQKEPLDKARRFEALVLIFGLVIGMGLFALRSSFAEFIRFPFSAALATLIWLKVRLLYEEGRAARLLHPIFRPVPLAAPVVERRRAFLQSCLAAVGMSLAVLLPPVVSADEIILPQPASLQSVGENLDQVLSESRELGRENGLPSLADYLAHRYFQENYLFGAVYELPRTEEELTIPVYREEEGRIRGERKHIWRFTYSWYNAIIADETDRITHFFVHEDVPRSVGRAALAAKRAPVDGLYPGLGLLFSLLAVMLVLAFRRRKETADTRFVPRRLSQTA